jgi:hypothetical protein
MLLRGHIEEPETRIAVEIAQRPAPPIHRDGDLLRELEGGGNLLKGHHVQIFSIERLAS